MVAEQTQPVVLIGRAHSCTFLTLIRQKPRLDRVTFGVIIVGVSHRHWLSKG